MLGASIPANNPQPAFTAAELFFLFFIFKFKVARTRNGALKVKNYFRKFGRDDLPVVRRRSNAALPMNRIKRRIRAAAEAVVFEREILRRNFPAAKIEIATAQSKQNFL